MIMEIDNQVILSGTIGRIKTQTVGDNKKLTQLGIAVNEKLVKNETTGKDEKITLWENADCWGKVSLIAQSYKKGDVIFVTGIRKIDKYTNQAGEEKESNKVSASFILKLGTETQKSNTTESKPTTSAKELEPVDNDTLPF